MGTLKNGIEGLKEGDQVVSVLELIEAGQDTVKDISTVLGKTAQTTRSFLNRIRDQKLIKIRKEGSGGRNTYWKLDTAGRKALDKIRGNGKPEVAEPEPEIPLAPPTAKQEQQQRIDELKAQLEEEYQALRVEQLMDAVSEIDTMLSTWAKEHTSIRISVEAFTPEDAWENLTNKDIQLQF